MVSMRKPSIISGPDKFGRYYLAIDSKRGMSASNWEILVPYARDLYPLLTKVIAVSGQAGGIGDGWANFRKTSAYE